MNSTKVVEALNREREKLTNQIDKLDLAIAALSGTATKQRKRGSKQKHLFRRRFKSVCQLPSCKRDFTAKKRNAKWCSRKCRSFANSPAYKTGGLKAPRGVARGVTLLKGDPLTAGH